VLGYGVFAYTFIETSGDVHRLAWELCDLYESAFVVAVGGAASLVVELRGQSWQHMVGNIEAGRCYCGIVALRVTILAALHKHDWSRLTDEDAVSARSAASTACSIDAIDSDILRVLAGDGRASYADIAREVSVSQGTARVRVKRLEAAGAVAVRTTVSAGFGGPNGYVAAGLTVSGSATSVAKRASEMAPVALVATTIGTFDVVAEIGYRDSEDVLEVLNALRSIPGVKHVESFEYLAVFKESMNAGLWPSSGATSPA